MIYFISGHRNITDEEFLMHYAPKILDALRDPNAEFVVGECDGVDIMAQQFLNGLINKNDLTVYHIGDKPINISGDWKTRGGYNDHIHRDSIMTKESDIDIFWIREWGQNSGTEQNIIRRSNNEF